jgi:formylglycine-generating enzyme required for sulfatase activity
LKDADGELKERDREAARLGRRPADGRGWYVNGQGQTFVHIDAGEFLMGRALTEADWKGERRHRRRIDRPFWMAAKEVTLGQFLTYYTQCYHRQPNYLASTSPTPEHPMNCVTWKEAAAYCNWLSEREGIPPDEWCYEVRRREGSAPDVRPRPGFLRKTGYRLPTEAEWEYACRAGTVTSRYYGETEELLGEYAWYAAQSQARGLTTPADRKPNDFGLFDMLGNALEWCQDVFWEVYPGTFRGEPTGNQEDLREQEEGVNRVMRGGCFSFWPAIVRSATRFYLPSEARQEITGFRPARTVR